MAIENKGKKTVDAKKEETIFASFKKVEKPVKAVPLPSADGSFRMGDTQYKVVSKIEYRVAEVKRVPGLGHAEVSVFAARREFDGMIFMVAATNVANLHYMRSVPLPEAWTAMTLHDKGRRFLVFQHEATTNTSNEAVEKIADELCDIVVKFI